jgi:Zn-finger nucleic acid-binding protein
MHAANESLTCPKCGGAMRSYERNGVTVDQCGECRGVFLDRGELERLIDAESSHYEREFSDRSRGYEERPPRDRDDKSEHKPKKSKKKSFLENLMEGIGE